MPQPVFEKLIKDYEEDLQKVRNKYFPLIDERIITGYNLYHNLFDYSDGEFFLNYLHSDLRLENRHLKELSEVLKSEGFLEERIIINNQLVDRKEITEREADYITKPDWEDPQNMRYFDFEGNEIPSKKAKSLGKELIGESLQYDLLLRAKDKLELRKLINLFKKYTSKDKLDKNGRKVVRDYNTVKNRNAIFGAYNIPLLICTSTDNKKPANLCDFLTVNQFNIPERLGSLPITLSTLVRKNTRELRKILNKRKIKAQSDKKYVLRVFIEEYIDA